eukprot:SAG31_NODE_17524_length_667_cov_1.357394_1_plen_63_part_10
MQRLQTCATTSIGSFNTIQLVRSSLDCFEHPLKSVDKHFRFAAWNTKTTQYILQMVSDGACTQ